MTRYPIIEFEQFESGTGKDRLIMFAAPAREILKWAGIPRQGWQVRMLYQRWLTDSRLDEVTNWWNEAGTRRTKSAAEYLLGPTALTLALQDDPDIQGSDGIALKYERPFKITADRAEKLRVVAGIALNRFRSRLKDEETAVLDDFLDDPTQDIPDLSSQYVLEGMCHVAAMEEATAHYIEANELDTSDVDSLIESLEALCRPALVVDGQHRLYGAAHSRHDVWLPVVAMPNCDWMEQIYQFVVINEKAQRVKSTLLTDIFGSSLTRSEQEEIRKQLERSNVSVEERIAAVVAAREPTSPFYGLVKVGVTPEDGSEPFIPESTIRELIEGRRGTRGWRTDEEFYRYYVKPTFPVETDWNSWTEGAWNEYWLAFWAEVRDFYNSELPGDKELWGSDVGQTNLTKAVALRLFQRLFIEKAIEKMKGIEQSRETLVEVLGEDEAERKLGELREEKAIPDTPTEFREQIRDWFLSTGVPVRLFEYPWKSSLDDSSGQRDLYDEMNKAYTRIQAGEIYKAQNADVYAAGEK